MANFGYAAASMVKIDLFDGVNTRWLDYELAEDSLQLRLDGIIRKVKASTDAQLVMSCRPEDKAVCEEKLEELCSLVGGEARRIIPSDTGMPDAAEIVLQVDREKLLDPSNLAKFSLNHFRKKPDLLDSKGFTPDERQQVEDIITWQNVLTPNHHNHFDARVRGAVAEVLMCRLFRDMQDEYGKGAVQLLERPTDNALIKYAPFLQSGRELEFFSRNSCGFRDVRGDPRLEFDGVLRLCNECTLILDASTSIERALGKDVEYRREIAQKYFRGEIGFMNVLFSNNLTFFDEGGTTRSIHFPRKATVRDIAKSIESTLPEELRQTSVNGHAADERADIQAPSAFLTPMEQKTQEIA